MEAVAVKREAKEVEEEVLQQSKQGNRAGKARKQAESKTVFSKRGKRFYLRFCTKLYVKGQALKRR